MVDIDLSPTIKNVVKYSVTLCFFGLLRRVPIRDEFFYNLHIFINVNVLLYVVRFTIRKAFTNGKVCFFKPLPEDLKRLSLS